MRQATLDHAAITRLVPHHGAMCLLEAVRTWSAEEIVCEATSHLASGNPLRRAGRLSALCGCEYGAQAMALHGALLAGEVAQPAGFLAALRVTEIGARRLDDPAHGTLTVEAGLEMADSRGLIYAFRVASAVGATLLAGRATIVLPG